MEEKEQWELVKARVEKMPPRMKISIGKLIFEIELNYLKALKEL